MRFQPSAWLLAVAVGLAAPVVLAVGALPDLPAERQQFAVPAAVPGPPVLSHSVVGSTVSMTWSPAATGGVPASYVLEASLTPGGAAVAAFTVNVTTYTVPNVPAGTYFVRVRAVNTEGAGPPSNEITVVVGAPCASPPGAPGTLTATPPGPSVTLTWSAPAGGCPATEFVLRAGFASGQDLFNVPLGPNTSFTGTAAQGTYFVRVVAVNANGEGPPSNEVTVIISCVAPGPPIGLGATVNGRTVSLNWSPPASGGAADGYVLEAGQSSGATTNSIPLIGNSFSTVAPDGTYFVRVRATNACGVSPPSNEQIVVVPNCGPNLGAPSTPTATVNGGTATISWSAVNGAMSYRLEVGTTPAASNTASQVVSGTSQQLNLSSGTYFMRVRALNSCGSTGPPSGEGSFTIVTPVTLVSIAVTGPASLVMGQSGQFTATGTFSNGTTANVTTTAAWASSNGSVAAPVSPGTINALATGTTNISASRDGRTGTASLQVVQPRATFIVVTDPSTIPPARTGQCLVRRRAPNEPNHLVCTFDGSASVPDNATYAWQIPVGVPNGNTDVVNGRLLTFQCGTLGEDGVADDFDVRLTVTVGSTTVVETRTISFLKAGAC
jgi:predicted phage tail protein